MTDSRHLVVGAGPVGSTTALRLAALGISATPIEEGAAATVRWWRSRLDG